MEVGTEQEEASRTLGTAQIWILESAAAGWLCDQEACSPKKWRTCGVIRALTLRWPVVGLMPWKDVSQGHFPLRSLRKNNLTSSGG